MTPPGNTTALNPTVLRRYLQRVADEIPNWKSGRYVAFPAHPADFDLNEGVHLNQSLVEHMKKFGGGRQPMYYDERLQNAHHIHFTQQHRVLQHHYGK